MGQLVPLQHSIDAWDRDEEGNVVGTIGTLLRPPAGWKPTKEQRKKWARKGGFEDSRRRRRRRRRRRTLPRRARVTRRVETE
jgi:hypothetical protein